MLADIDADYVIDHMGYMLESDGLGRAEFDRLIDVVSRSRGWMKLSVPIDSRGMATMRSCGHSRVRSSTLAAAARSGAAIGPHIPNGQMDTGKLLNLLADWCPMARNATASSATTRGGCTASEMTTPSSLTTGAMLCEVQRLPTPAPRGRTYTHAGVTIWPCANSPRTLPGSRSRWRRQQ